MPQDLFVKPKKLRASTPQEIAASNERMRQWRTAHPIKAGIEDFLGGAFGFDSIMDDTPERKISKPGALGEALSFFDEPVKGLKLLGAIPFPVGKKVYHATKRQFDKLDPSKGLTGTNVHFAENPDWAKSVANEGRQGGELDDPRIIPAKLKASYALDAVNPDNIAPEDLGRLKSYIQYYHGKSNPDLDYLPSIREIGKDLIAHRKGTLERRGYPASNLSGKIRQLTGADPDARFFEQFDALRYKDLDDPIGESWVVRDANLAVHPETEEVLGVPAKRKQRFLASPEGIIDTQDYRQVRKLGVDVLGEDKVRQLETDPYKIQQNVGTGKRLQASRSYDYDAAINAKYSAKQAKTLIEEAEFLGIDWNKFPNYEALEKAILNHPDYLK